MTATIPTALGLAGAANITHPRFLVSFAFDAPDADAAQAATDQLADLMQTSDAVPAFPGLAAYKPVQVAPPSVAIPARSAVLILDPGEVSTLMAAILDAIDDCDDTLDGGEQANEYRAIADKLL